MAINIDALLADYWRAKQTADEVAAELGLAKERLLEAMGGEGQKTHTGTIGGHVVKATVIEGTRIIIDEAKLKKTLGAPMWNKVTVQKLDKALLEAHVTTGDIDANKVAMCSEEVKNAPYIKVTDQGAAPGNVEKKRVPSKAAKKVRK